VKIFKQHNSTIIPKYLKRFIAYFPPSASPRTRRGFTLAEVLIVLGIIGIIADMTIPTLISNVTQQQYVVGLQKAYTEWNQALSQLAADDGCVGDLACTGIFGAGTTNESLGNEIVKYFKITRNCETIGGGQDINGCFTDFLAGNYDGTGRNPGFDEIGNYRFITADGMAFSLGNMGSSMNPDCQNGASSGVTGNMNQVCGTVYVDVNGPNKGPNNMGRDIFDFYITNGHGILLYPDGGSDLDGGWGPWKDSDGNPQYCYKDNTNGGSCAGRIMEEGWQMTY